MIGEEPDDHVELQDAAANTNVACTSRIAPPRRRRTEVPGAAWPHSALAVHANGPPRRPMGRTRPLTSFITHSERN